MRISNGGVRMGGSAVGDSRRELWGVDKNITLIFVPTEGRCLAGTKNEGVGGWVGGIV